jgi:hypothetical protein
MVELSAGLVNLDSSVKIIMRQLVLFSIEVHVTTVEEVFCVGAIDCVDCIVIVFKGRFVLAQVVVRESPVV